MCVTEFLFLHFLIKSSAATKVYIYYTHIIDILKPYNIQNIEVSFVWNYCVVNVCHYETVIKKVPSKPHSNHLLIL